MTWEDKLWLWNAAKRKASLSQVANTSDNRRTRFSAKEKDNKRRSYIGFFGELVASRYLGIEWEPRVKNWKDPGYDLVWNGMRINVKMNSWRTGPLYVKLSDKLNSAIHMVVGIDREGHGWVEGWIESAKILEAPIEDPGNRNAPCRIVRHHGLNPLRDLTDAIPNPTRVYTAGEAHAPLYPLATNQLKG